MDLEGDILPWMSQIKNFREIFLSNTPAATNEWQRFRIDIFLQYVRRARKNADMFEKRTRSLTLHRMIMFHNTRITLYEDFSDENYSKTILETLRLWLKGFWKHTLLPMRTSIS